MDAGLLPLLLLLVLVGVVGMGEWCMVEMMAWVAVRCVHCSPWTN
jgi:hypothetical protein